jgi:hypothetical protein
LKADRLKQFIAFVVLWSMPWIFLRTLEIKCCAYFALQIELADDGLAWNVTGAGCVLVPVKALFVVLVNWMRVQLAKLDHGVEQASSLCSRLRPVLFSFLKYRKEASLFLLPLHHEEMRPSTRDQDSGRRFAADAPAYCLKTMLTKS